ncbi:MAG: acyl-CoA dehydrogenase family protein, partial [Acidimicrobiales bacterium]
MSIAIGDDHVALLESVRRFTGDRCGRSVVRAAVDAAEEALPPFWDDLAALGWLGLHLPTADGGEGYGVAELAVVLEELGRSLTPGPFLPTVLASAAISRGGGSAELLRELAAGRQIGTVALGDPLAGEAWANGAVLATGSSGPVLCGALADVVVVPVTIGDEERWYTVARARGTTTPLESLDPTRRLADVAFDGVELALDDHLAGLDRATLDAMAAVLAAADAAGGAAWCLDTAGAYAAVRTQFGRPIGQ